jgi:lysozyme
MKEEIDGQPELTELDIKRQELELKEKQFELEKKSKKYFLSPGMAALIAALFGIFASVITASITGQENIELERIKQEQNIELERLKQEFQIIISASENRTKKEAAENLLFFVDIGILQDENGKIRELAEAGEAPIITSNITNPSREKQTDLKLPNEDAANNAIGFYASSYEGAIDWPTIKKAPVSFAIVQATKGDDYLDPQFYNNWESAKDNGIIRAATHRYDDCVSPETQAEYFVSLVNIENTDIAPILMVEQIPNSCLEYSDPSYLQGILDWLELIEKEYSRTPIIYTTTLFWNQITVEDFSRFPLWTANIGFESPFIPKSWGTWTFWHYTESATLEGTSSDRAAMILFNGSVEELQTFIEEN